MNLPPIEYYIGLSPAEAAKLRAEGMMEDYRTHFRRRLKEAKAKKAEAEREIARVHEEAMVHMIDRF